MQMSVERANQLRQKILAGEDPTDDEMREIISALIADRAAATEAAPKASNNKKASQPKVDLNDLL